MKIIHCADIHLGSKMDCRLPPERAEERRRELRSTFTSMVEYAKRENVRAIILAGDVFDSDRPLKKDKEFFYSVVKNNPEIDFLYLRGNHDSLQSYTVSLENLKCFGAQWIKYTYGNVTVSGLEINPANADSLYSTLRLDADKINIVTLHAQAENGGGAGKINLSRLREKNIDYLALGHIHSFYSGEIDSRGRYAYSGCLEGRGFDEEGEKGFILLDADGKLTYKFVPFAKRTVKIFKIDISACGDEYSVFSKVKEEINCKSTDIVRVILCGETSFDTADLSKELEKRLADGYFYIEVKNAALRKFDLQKLQGDLSIKGEFVRAVLAGNLPEDKKSEIISLGLAALDGREVL